MAAGSVLPVAASAVSASGGFGKDIHLEPSDSKCDRWLAQFYGKLPQTFITKAQAEALGWPGNKKLDNYARDKCIGGDYFGNMEGLLPTKKGRKYTECDIGTLHQKERGVKRIVFSNDGLIFYTDDHYETFEQLY